MQIFCMFAKKYGERQVEAEGSKDRESSTPS